ncbi:hypothetical protein [Cryobacterium sp. CG_9.6]|uniref:hypothetical protein n=1 Tax=Cryobacterium sp. CG_9.6 TaxID=2760710 RepID=UPI002475C92F|nr:hypothetical protein [Cryobacterium sp. CG_9.6]MDH6236806.1 hypothetical protein [Cryobacterium sp. CG_9.6]
MSRAQAAFHGSTATPSPSPFGDSGDSGDRAPQDIQHWVRCLLPAGFTGRAVLSFDSWGGSPISIEVSLDAAGQLRIADHTAAKHAVDALQAGLTVVVQVCTTDAAADESATDPSTTDAPALPTTTRVWLFSVDGVRAVEAEVLQACALSDVSPLQDGDCAHFETGWTLTERPGGA